MNGKENGTAWREKEKNGAVAEEVEEEEGEEEIEIVIEKGSEIAEMHSKGKDLGLETDDGGVGQDRLEEKRDVVAKIAAEMMTTLMEVDERKIGIGIAKRTGKGEGLSRETRTVRHENVRGGRDEKENEERDSSISRQMMEAKLGLKRSPLMIMIIISISRTTKPRR
ncbi:unnamed protein product [Acanthoscelides obtectus]|uniref:Uncharacterized protein n=1 Tax=Acanthoscelides obtectus TaxID=200917 RepID=A0A9P0PGB6_ACAOB|nr:unnamed protein product [Acanthoscelides obtectus]CAK1639233.1 hypothetical protein AOBTE_LOCUS11060 [Acanthoscelides obtectus]